MEYVIRLVNDTKNKPEAKAVTKADQDEGIGGEVSDGNKVGDYALKMAKRLITVHAVVNTADQIVSHNHSKISLQTGAQEYGQRASFVYQKTSSFAKSVAYGAMAGATVAGWQGALVGAAFAAVGNIGGNFMDYLFKQDLIETQRDLENISREIRMSRATVSGRRYSNTTEY